MKIKETIIKALSLGTGLAIGMLLIAKVCHEMSYDRCYRESENIWQIRTLYNQQGEEIEYDNISGAVAPGFKEYVPGVETATRTTFIWNSDKFTDEERNEYHGIVVIADTCFFDVFDTEILAGDPKEVLGKMAAVMVSESFAEKMGGVTEAMGKVIANDELPQFKMTIEGVFKDFPHHSSQKYDVLLSMESYGKGSTENWVGNDRYKGYVRLEDGIDPDMLAPAIRRMQETNYPAEVIKMAESSGMDIHYFLVPFASKHVSDPSVRNIMVILSVVAFLLIAISLLNYVLMSVSALVKRSKEMGVRKCYGAGNVNIYGTMIKEAAADIVSSLAVAAAIIMLLKPLVEDIVGVPVDALFVDATWTTLMIIVLLVFIVAALIPGWLYSRIPATAAIKNHKENKRVWKLCLLFLQNGICALLLTLVCVINAQYRKSVNDKPGYEYSNLLWTDLRGTWANLHQGIIDEVKRIPGVLDVQMSYSLPLDYSSGNNVYMMDNGYEELFNFADQYEGTAGLFEMLEIPFIEGRYPQTAKEIAVSESWVKKMSEYRDWSDGAIGKQVWLSEHSNDGSVFTISGIYKDYRIHTLTEEDGRSSIRFLGEVGTGYMPFMLIKVNEVSAEMMKKVEDMLQSRIEDKDVVVKSYKDSMREAYSSERRMRNTVIIGCVVSIIIALFGLIGYVRDESQRRSKEMAVRKINGASVKEIVGIYVGEIIKLSIPAIIIGNVGAWFAATLWLKNFSEKVALSAWYFIFADVIILALVTASIILNSLRISRSNPVESLKNE